MSLRRFASDRGLPRYHSRIEGKVERKQEMVARFDMWLEHQEFTPGTRKYYCNIVRESCSYFGKKTFRSIAPLDIENFLQHASRSGWNCWKYRHYLAALRCFFEFLYLGGVVDSIAPRFVRGPRIVHRQPKVLTQSEVNKLIESATTPRDRALLEFLYSTGCRLCELLQLKVEDIDWRHRRTCVYAKRRERTVYIGGRAAKALRFYLGSRKTGPLFLDDIPAQTGQLARSRNIWQARWREYPSGSRRTRYLGNPNKMSYAAARKKFKSFIRATLLKRERRAVTNYSVKRMVRQLGERLGLKGASARMLRHCFATHLVENGADIRVIQALMGHAFLSTTAIYASVSNIHLESVYRNCHPRA